MSGSRSGGGSESEVEMSQWVAAGQGVAVSQGWR